MIQIEWFTVGVHGPWPCGGASPLRPGLSYTVHRNENMNSVEICTYVVALLRHTVMEPIAPGHVLPRTLE
jgi:hypothetical protein